MNCDALWISHRMHDKSDTFQTKVCLNNINVTDSTCWLAIIYILPVHSCMSVCRLQGGMVLICFIESYGLPCLQGQPLQQLAPTPLKHIRLSHNFSARHGNWSQSNIAWLICCSHRWFERLGFSALRGFLAGKIEKPHSDKFSFTLR